MKLDRPLVVTAGEPAGVGPELCNRLAETPWCDRIVVIGDRRQIDDRLDAERAQVIGRPHARELQQLRRRPGDVSRGVEVSVMRKPSMRCPVASETPPRMRDSAIGGK